MQIEEQIKRLLRVKAKMDLYRKVMENLNSELASIDQDAEHKALEACHPGLIKEVCEEVERFCTRTIENLNGSASSNMVPAPVVATPHEVPVIAADKKPAPEEEPADPLRFLMKYRHLDGKKVTYTSNNGPVEATVRGMVTPFLRIQTVTGFELNVKPSEISVIA